MPLIELLNNKPVLIGLHLGFAIAGIDAFFWLYWELATDFRSKKRAVLAAISGTTAFVLSWLAGGYYYVFYYGKLVKPVIQKGLAPWAHAIFMEAKEHIFLLIIPLAVTAAIAAFLNKEELQALNLQKPLKYLTGLVVFFGLLIGLFGFIISAAARWGIK
ncbi:MAG: hypothetical protein A2746_00555 [Candidatus Yanofskybacteria bacterium RIFCSPHIGHO2_01_FULL_44_22]|uniref:DUF2231 domain-containing protein n=1 Tax=Candidatus Yanofskybacteria bacterium RIFCSPHIGHO2_01_FULL_44_22 TaxID=1802669 RepID=A0A1F8EXV0_9BACT|nr:MAG: hypothetical protein UW71_C0038G0002 [Parcubacteria group bacterium GW2011_GWB1_44_7]OGN05697.1 MAG: hypothetical protein A2746_00555 [Candidatus Yanofskybacteria bacterium RIFCSPHIGHO2_01_FULL_44_22]